MRQFTLIVLFGLFWQCTVGYKILCIFAVPSKSHGHLAKGIVDPFLKAGHQVTWVSPFTDWKLSPNLTLIGVPEIRSLISDDSSSKSTSISFVKEFARNISMMTIANEKVRKTLIEEQYDAVITEWFMTDIDAGYAAVQQAPWIMLSGMVMHYHLEYLVDQVRTIPTIPFPMLEATVPMTFFDRIKNTAFFAFMFGWMMLERPAATELYEARFSPIAKARGVTLPPYEEALHNISILFVNSHPSFALTMSVPPNVIEIGGYHIDEEIAPLPKDLQELLDGSPQGVVYFSMGSVFKASAMPASTARALANMLGELPHTVLWKYEAPLADLPTNVHIRPWLPQASILAHRNTVLFITHGGLLSMLEAVRRGVPLLAMPVFGDQPANAARAVQLGMARRVMYSPEVVPQLTVELKEMLGNRSYYERAQQLSRLFNARPVAPRKLITHYVELAIETKGAFHLRSLSHQYPWWVRWMLDQILAALAALGMLIGLAALAIKRLKAMCTKTTKGKSTKQKKS